MAEINRAIVIAESLARVLLWFESIVFVGTRRNQSLQSLRALCRDSNCAIGVHSINIRSIAEWLARVDCVR